MPEFGNSFKSAREAKGLVLEKIAQETRISTRFLRAIENEDFETLPGGVFNRGFIRTYATVVGLDPEIAVAEYTAMTTTVATPLLEEVASEKSRAGSPDRRIVPGLVGALGVLIVLFYVFGQNPAEITDTVTDTDTRTEQATSEGANTVARATPEDLVDSVSEIPTSKPDSKPAATGPAHEVTEDTPPEPPVEETVTAGAADAPAGVTDAPDAGVRIQLQVHDQTWVSILSDDEEIVELLLDPGTNRSFSAREAMELIIGNAAGLTLYINGRQAENLGREGQVRTLRITPDNYERYTGS
jgi:cytoskeleton protein RodZ